MSLLFQPNEADFIVVWDGRAGAYLHAELAANAARFPTRLPNAEEIAGMHLARHDVPKHATHRTLAREFRFARGICRDCPNLIGPGEVNGNTRCVECRTKESKAQSIHYFATKKQRAVKINGMRCSRCKRRRREYSQWCRLCYDRSA